MPLSFLRRLAVVASFFGVALSASAELTYDLRLNDSNADGNIYYPGQVIALDLFARVTGAAGNAAVEGFQEGYASIMSSNGGTITGGLSATLAAPFNVDGAQKGKSQDLDGDGDDDLGSNLLTSSPDFLYARAASMQTSSPTPILDGMEFKLATVLFTTGSGLTLVNGDTVTISVRVTTFTGRTAIEALWRQDGTFMSSSEGGNAPTPSEGSSVTLKAIPELSSAALLGLGTIAGCAFSRRRRPIGDAAGAAQKSR